MKILAVDDDPVFLGILENVLESEGYKNLVLCTSAKEALELLTEDGAAFDCFLLDISMPRKDGISLCKEIRNFPGHEETPILMITARCDLSLIDRAFSAGATDYISKPIQGLELGSRIRIAKLIKEQARRISAMTIAANDRTPKALQESDNSFEGELAVRGIAGIQEYFRLRNELLSLAQGPYNLGIFALKVEGAEALFDKLGANSFHNAMTNLAKSISEELDLSNTKFTYAGRGIFGCVQYGRTLLPINFRSREKLCRKLQIGAAPENGEAIDVEVILATSQSPGVWTGRSAAEALSKAVEKAITLADDIQVQRKLDAKRLSDPVRPRRHKIEFRRLLYKSSDLI